jgi:hypothetical protein
MPVAAGYKTVLDIRATHGGGKSWIIHNLLATFGNEPIEDNGVVLGHAMPKLRAVVVGPYTKVCGGCDAINKVEEATRRLELFLQTYKAVFMEGIRVAHTFQRYSDLAKELEAQGIHYKFLFLDTPLETCVQRVLARRQARGDTRPFDPKNVHHDYKAIWERCRQKCLNAGHRVVIVPWQNPLPTVLEALQCP